MLFLDFAELPSVSPFDHPQLAESNPGTSRVASGRLEPISVAALNSNVFSFAGEADQNQAIEITTYATDLLAYQGKDVLRLLYQDPDNYYGLNLYRNGANDFRPRLYRRVGGTSTLIGSFASGMADNIAETGTRIRLELAWEGDAKIFRFFRNGVEVGGGITSSSAAIVEGVPAFMVHAHGTSSRRFGPTELSMEGVITGAYVSGVAPSPYQNGSGNIVIAGTAFEPSGNAVTLTQGGRTLELTTLSESETAITCAPLDIHETDLMYGACTISVNDSPQRAWTISPAAGNQVTMIGGAVTDETSMAHGLNSPVDGDQILTPASVAGSALTVNSDGTFMLDPAVPDGTVFARRHYSAVRGEWDLSLVTISDGSVLGGIMLVDENGDPVASTDIDWCYAPGWGQPFEASGALTTTAEGRFAPFISAAAGTGLLICRGPATEGVRPLLALEVTLI